MASSFLRQRDENTSPREESDAGCESDESCENYDKVREFINNGEKRKGKEIFDFVLRFHMLERDVDGTVEKLRAMLKAKDEKMAEKNRKL